MNIFNDWTTLDIIAVTALGFIFALMLGIGLFNMLKKKKQIDDDDQIY